MGRINLLLLPRCGHCKQFAPEYEKIASALKENDPPIPVAKIDATSESALASRFDVSGYPTIKALKKGQAVDYEGSRTQEGEWSLCSWGRRGWDSLPTGKLKGGSLDKREEDKLVGWEWPQEHQLLEVLPAGMFQVTEIKVNLS